MNSYWDNEDFEDRVAKGIIALYETNIPKKFRFTNIVRKVYPVDIKQIKILGLYFTPEDRVTTTSVIEDNPCLFGCYTAKPDKEITEDEAEKNNLPEINGYVNHIFFRQSKQIPSVFITPSVTGILYEIFSYSPFYTEGIMINKSYALIGKDGKVHPLRERVIKDYPYPTQVRKDEDKSAIILAAAHGLWSDRKYLWNVQAMEHDARVLFGVYPEQIKSLFYARSLPISDSGRKRPILHWVAAHRRRLKNGIDIDIDTYLRGTEEFIMNGTKFKITQPIK